MNRLLVSLFLVDRQRIADEEFAAKESLLVTCLVSSIDHSGHCFPPLSLASRCFGFTIHSAWLFDWLSIWLFGWRIFRPLWPFRRLTARLHAHRARSIGQPRPDYSSALGYVPSALATASLPALFTKLSFRFYLVDRVCGELRTSISPTQVSVFANDACAIVTGPASPATVSPTRLDCGWSLQQLSCYNSEKSEQVRTSASLFGRTRSLLTSGFEAFLSRLDSSAVQSTLLSQSLDHSISEVRKSQLWTIESLMWVWLCSTLPQLSSLNFR